MRSRMRLAAAAAAVLLPLALAACGGKGKGSASAPTGTAGGPPPGAGKSILVVNGDTRAPIPGATVTAFEQGKQAAAASDAQGRATVPASTTGACASTPTFPQDCRTVLPERPEVTIPLYDPAMQSPEYGGGPDRTRYVPGVKAPPPSGPPKWRYTGKALLEFPPAVAGGVVALTTNRGRIIVFDADTGRKRWNRKHPTRQYPASSEANNIASSPAILTEEKRVIVSGMDGRLAAYELGSGRLMWQQSTGQSPIESSPLVVDGAVFVGAWNGRMYAFSTKSGRPLWNYQAGDDVKGSAAQAGDLVIFGDYSGNVYGVRRANGTLAWRTRAGQKFYGGAAVSDGVAVMGDVGGAVVGLDAATGRRLWRHPTGAAVYSSPAIARGTVFIGSYSGRFEALGLKSGRVKWSYGAGGRISGSATVVGNTVYTAVLARRGEPDRAYGLDVASGAVRWTGNDGRYSPAVAAGRTLYIVGRTTLYAYPAR